MAPKRRGSLIGVHVPTGRRSGGRTVREPTPPTDSGTESDAPNLSSSQIDTLAGRVITMGRKVDFSFFESEGFSLGNQLKDLGWDKLCSLDVPTYPALVKEFYFNLSRGDGGILSNVRGKRIHLTFQILGNLLSIPTIGLIADAHSDRSGALSRMLGREIMEFEEICANQLPLELRLLHNICSRILFPKTGRFEYVSERDILLMDSVLTGIPVNLAAMMIYYMAEAGGKRRSSLPYGMVLTMVFRSQGVNILENEPSKNLRHTDYYSLATLHRMGFVKKEGQWMRKGSIEERMPEPNRPTHSEAGPSVRLPTPPPESVPIPSSPTPAHASTSTNIQHSSNSTGFSDLQIEQLKGLFAAQKEELKLEFDSQFMNLKESLYALDDRISKVESTVSSSAKSLNDDLKNIFEELKDICGDSEVYSTSNAELSDKITAACTFVDEKLKGYVKVQTEGMQRIIDHLTRITRQHF